MQAGGVTTTDTYRVTGRVLINGTDIGADSVTVSGGRDIPSRLPGSSGFQSASFKVTAVRGGDVSDRVAHPWNGGQWPPRPGARAEIWLGDGPGRDWRQVVGTVKNPTGESSSRQISFTVQDNYESLNRPVNMPALSSSMPALVDANYFIYNSLLSTFIVDWALRQAGRYSTPPYDNQSVVSATMQGSTWPERGTITYSQKQAPDGGSESFPNWDITHYGRCVQNVDAQYEPNVWSGTLGGGRVTSHPVELTQEIVDIGPGSTFVRAYFPGGGQLGLAQNQSTVFARYYRPDGSTADLAVLPRSGLTRATVRFSWSNGTLTGEVRGQTTSSRIISSGTGTVSAGTLTGVIEQVRANGTGAQGAFQVAFPSTAWSKLTFRPSARIHAARTGINSFTGFRTQIDVPAIDLLSDIADAELAQWWIDENDVLQWWDRGLLAQQPVKATLTGADHVSELSWSNDHDDLKRAVHVKYQAATPISRWRTTLTLWQGNSSTYYQGDVDETFINTPNDEIWLGVDVDSPVRYGRTATEYWAINRGIRSVLGGIAVDDDGERLTNSIVQSLRRVTDETFVVETDVRTLSAGEQAALQFASDSDTDTSLWSRWRGKKLPILRGKKKIVFTDEMSTSSITATTTGAPDYTHNVGEFIQSQIYAGLTADYIAASVTNPQPKLERTRIMPVLNLQAGDRVIVDIPDVVGLRIDGVVTSIDTEADLATGTASQHIRMTPRSVTPIGATWEDFGRVHGGRTWQTWSNTTGSTTWSDFGNTPLS